MVFHKRVMLSFTAGIQCLDWNGWKSRTIKIMGAQKSLSARNVFFKCSMFIGFSELVLHLFKLVLVKLKMTGKCNVCVWGLVYLLISQVFNIKSSQADSVLTGQLWLFFLYYSIILYTRVYQDQVFWSYNKKGVQPFELTCLCKMYASALHVNKCS